MSDATPDRLRARLSDALPVEALGTWFPPSAWRSTTGEDPSVPLAAPDDQRGFQQALALAAEDDLRVLPIGLGSKLGWIARPPHIDLVLSTHRYRGVTNYEPADGTATALAGTPMADFAAVVGEGGHHLSPAVPRPERSTLGGVVAAGQSGDDRLRYGALRENLLGTRVLLADGTTARSGGQLVKNVTGYDLHRLHCGSFGSLCLVLDASLRLYPAPEERAVVLAHASTRDEALELAQAIRAAELRPVTLMVHDLDATQHERPWTVLVTLAAHPEVLESELAVLAAIRPDADVARGSRVSSVLASVRDLELSDGAWPALVLESRPSRLPRVLDLLRSASAAAGLEGKLQLHPALGRAVVWFRAADPAAGSDRATLLPPERLRALDDALTASGDALLRWRDLPPSGAGAVALRGRTPHDEAAARLSDSLRSALDPGGLFAPRPWTPPQPTAPRPEATA